MELPRGLVVLLGTAAAVVAGAGVMAMSWLIGPVFLALTLVIAVSPVRSWLRRKGLPSWVATTALVLGVYAILLSLVAVLVVSVAQLATELPRYADRGRALADAVAGGLAGFGVGAAEFAKVADSLDVGRVAGILGTVLSGVGGLASNIVFLLCLLLFLCVDASGAGARMAVIAADRPEVAAALGRFAAGTRKYLVVSTVFGLIVAVLDGVALAIMGIPLPILWALLAFITNYIPNIGFVLGLAPPTLLALLEGGWQPAVWVVVVYSVLNFVVQTLIQPRFVGDSVGLSTTVTFLALLFWAWLLGGLGAVLAIPLTLLVKLLLVDIDPKARWADAFLTARVAPPDRAAE
ncbi:putative PurR-regulated permease PerM [Saccharothrix tamanrassetensis]|uniref:Putative PurR-regulated permease PerM n=1 Tax=Saccharothrix tamanrassetensis TaxID=1051531 RepID=A0A841CHD0_9PSEU|nr:AI-2E family transporter [Saccharothrix tamanrassetensis]MBB5956791.1 putative PurR-regulated permease PerM [Saccharothrix tamanrassetensis]